MSDVNNRATSTTPSEIPPLLIVALPANLVLPTPVNPASVIVPVVLPKSTLSAVVFALLTAPRLNPLPLILANPLLFTARAATLL
jgi:hypothetical protein